MQVYDRRMEELPDVGLMRVRDAETGHEHGLILLQRLCGMPIMPGGWNVRKN